MVDVKLFDIKQENSDTKPKIEDIHAGSSFIKKKKSDDKKG
jgi:hypothetical protein